MPKGLKTFVNRYAVLISVIYLGLVAVLQTLAQSGACEACGMIGGVVQTLFGLLALTPDPSLGPEVAALVAGAFATYGASRKVWSLVQKARQPKS